MPISSIFKSIISELDLKISEDLLESEILKILIEENLIETAKIRTFSSRNFDYWETSWGKLLRNPNTRDISSKEGRLFRRRFRVPFQIFTDVLLPKSKEHNIFDTRGTTQIPLEIKILMVLRVLGRNNCIDDIKELNGETIGESTINSIFKTFVTNFADRIFPLYVKEPSPDRMKKIMDVYKSLGVPGAAGSMDCTRLHWLMCPSSIRQSAIGKEGFPTLVFQVIVDHSRLIHYCSEYFLGGNNDINTTLNDKFPRKIMSGYYKDIMYFLYDIDGRPVCFYGAFLITDGGYPELAVFIDPDHSRVSRNEVLWSEWLESVRKDIECTFGILKQRFRFLRGPIVFHDPKVIEGAMKTCCALHNMCLVFDGLDIASWESVNWEELEPDLDEEDEIDNQTVEEEQSIENETITEDQHDDALVLSRTSQRINVRTGKRVLKEALQQHFSWAFRKGEIQWPKNMSKVQKTNIQMPVRRISDSIYQCLYSKESCLRIKDSSGMFTEKIGSGLFSTISFSKNDTITYFKGDLVSPEEYKVRCDSGHGGYAIKINKNLYLDCRRNYLNRKCMASFANSPKRAYNTVTRSAAIANCRVVVDAASLSAKLVCGAYKEDNRTPKNFMIYPDTEMLWDYESEYVFPGLVVENASPAASSSS
jgi:hypothetical protein